MTVGPLMFINALQLILLLAGIVDLVSSIRHKDASKYNVYISDGGRNSTQVHIIGNTNGDNNYLIRCLESTTRVVIENKGPRPRPQWATGMSVDESWEIVILGDVIDGGIRSRENLLTLKTLAEDETWGKRLVVLLGNHEHMLLLGDMRKAAGDTQWPPSQRLIDLTAQPGSEGYSLIHWLTTRPIVYFSHGLFMMHGGMSTFILHALQFHTGCHMNCGTIVANTINVQSRTFHENMHRSFVEFADERRLLALRSSVPYFLREAFDSVVWYEGWSRLRLGAGSFDKCDQSRSASLFLGAKAFVVAHTKRPRIRQVCDNPAFGAPVFAVDTHPSECNRTHHTECDFEYRHDNHPKYKEDDYMKTKSLPQHLLVGGFVDPKNRSVIEFAACPEYNHQPRCNILRVEVQTSLSYRVEVFDAGRTRTLYETERGQSVNSVQSGQAGFGAL